MSNFNLKGPMGEGCITGRKMGRFNNLGVAQINQTTQEKENKGNPINENSPEQGLGRGLGRRMGRFMENGMRQGRGMGKNRGGRGMGQSGGRRGMGRKFSDDIQE